MLKELHLCLDNNFYACDMEQPYIYCTIFTDTLKRINNPKIEYLWTSIPNFLCWDYAERLFVHVNGETHEITMGDCEGTLKHIRRAHNVMKILLAGGFDWYQPEKNYLNSYDGERYLGD